MGSDTAAPTTTTRATVRGEGHGPRRTTAALFVCGGLLMIVGGELHPNGSGDSVDAHLLSMFESPTWPLAHLLLLAGGVSSFLAFVAAWRTQAFGPRVQRWLPLVTLAWGFGAAEMVPHLLAAHEAQALAHHEATPVLDVHLVMQMIASPAVGITGAIVAVAIARAAQTRPSQLLAAFAVVGGLLYAVAGPLVVATGDPRYAILFAFQLGLAVWLTGTGVRLWLR